MGVHAADKLSQIVDNTRNVLAIELLCAAQGVDLRRPHRPGRALLAVLDCVRAQVPELKVDRPLHADIARVRALLDDGSVEAAVHPHLVLA
jgi:histidine ammonia-lyase